MNFKDYKKAGYMFVESLTELSFLGRVGFSIRFILNPKKIRLFFKEKLL